VKNLRRLGLIALIMFCASTFLILFFEKTEAQDAKLGSFIVGSLFDSQNQPISGAKVSLLAEGEAEPLSEVKSQADGRYALPVPAPISDSLMVHFERVHFKAVDFGLSPEENQLLQSGAPLLLPDVILTRHISPAFWIATVIFVIVLVLIATGYLHNTLAALVGAVMLFAVSYLDYVLHLDIFIFDFWGSLGYVDWNVVFLIMGMMIVIAVVENTGIFQWLAFSAYRISGGRIWLLLPILMLITGIASGFLDNVTTMLLMTPITVQIALALDINPLTLLMPEVMASNVIGVSTLVGTPTNILIGSYGDISFNDFLKNLTPGVLMAFVGLLIYSAYTYRKDLASAKEASPPLMKMLAERGRITEPEDLKKAGVVGAGMLILFIMGEYIHLLPAVTALIGATALLVWIKPDIEEMIEAVDWTTLVFFIALFIVVGAIQEVGLISIIADGIANLVGGSLILTMLAVIWLGAILSTVVANIPFTAAMLPVIAYLTATVPGAESKILFYCLSIGSAFGGNGSLIGASANMVTAGIADSAGYPITYIYFLKKGMPALGITVGLATIWLLLHFL
jgi:Na+/H+ antiporter NhaD/arsenite permease-like protein